MKFLATPAAVLLLGAARDGGTGVGAVRVTHDVHLDASLFRSTVARPRIDLYSEHRKYQVSEVIGGEREVPLVPENVPLAWKMLGWILGGA